MVIKIERKGSGKSHYINMALCVGIDVRDGVVDFISKEIYWSVSIKDSRIMEFVEEGIWKEIDIDDLVVECWN